MRLVRATPEAGNVMRRKLPSGIFWPPSRGVRLFAAVGVFFAALVTLPIAWMLWQDRSVPGAEGRAWVLFGLAVFLVLCGIALIASARKMSRRM